MNSILPPSNVILKKLEIDLTFISKIKSPVKRSQYRAVINWFTIYHTEEKSNNLDIVRGWLEAFHHLCELEEWEKATLLLCSRLETATREEFHDQLDIWGYHIELSSIYSRVVDQIPPEFKALILNGLGRLWTNRGDYEKAIAFHKQSLEIDEKLGQMQGVGASLGNLGVIYYSTGDYKSAI